MADYPQTFEEVEVGERYAFDRQYDVTREEIVEFAEQYDPQPMHVDEAAAEESIFGGLVASGWHTCAMTMRLIVEEYLTDSGAQGAAGADDLRWHQPVRPGDSLRLETEVVDKGPWSDDLGLVRSRVEVYDPDELVLSFVALVLWERAESL